MFNLNNFNAMLAKKGYTKTQLARELNINSSSLHRKIEKGGSFNIVEIRKMVAIFGKEEVFNSLFY